jgi:hypothetical protein
LIRDQWATHPPIYLQAYHNRIPGAIGSSEDTSYGIVRTAVTARCGDAAHRRNSKLAPSFLNFLLLNGAAQPQCHRGLEAVGTVLTYFMEIDSPFMEN